MQPEPVPETNKIRFQNSRSVLLGILWRRVLLSRRVLFSMSLVLACSIVLIATGFESVLGYVGIAFCIAYPLIVRRVLAGGIDANSHLTDLKTVEFGPTHFIVNGPNWKTEWPWTTFKDFSEDAGYFYLHLNDTGVTSVIPKSAFASAEQQDEFRRLANAGVRI